MKIDAEELREMRERSGMGMRECQRILKTRHLRHTLRMAESIDDLRDILSGIIEMTLPSDPDA